MPSRATEGSVGYDLTCSRITTEINECGQLIIVYHTDIAIELPEGYAAFIYPRSSISKKSLALCNSVGVIDSDYRGELIVKFKTTTDVIPAVYKEGERIAQLVIQKVELPTFVESTELEETDRGEGGFGSTDEEISADTATEESFEDKEASINSELASDQAAGDVNAPEQV